MSFKLEGLKTMRRNINKYKSAATERLEDATNVALINIQRGAKMRSPVDTGRLRSSIHLTQMGTDGIVYTNVNYAPFVEYGTGNLVEIPAGQEDDAAQFKGKGIREVNRAAQPFMFPSWEEERPKYIKRIRKALGKIRSQ